MITVGKTKGDDSVVIDIHDEDAESGHMIKLTPEEYRALVNTIFDHDGIPDADYGAVEAEPSPEDLILIEMEQQLARDDVYDRLYDREAELSQERARVRQLLNIVEELVMR